MQPPWPEFKMSEVAMSKAEERWERAQAFYRVIEKNVIGGLSVAIPLPPFHQLVKEFCITDEGANPYVLALETLVKGAALIRTAHGARRADQFHF